MKEMRTKRRWARVLAGVLLAAPATVFALEDRSFTLSGMNLTLFELLGNVVNMLVTWISGVCITIFLVGAFIMILNAGKEERAKQGKTLMTGAIIGLVVSLLSYAIVRTIFSIIF